MKNMLTEILLFFKKENFVYLFVMTMLALLLCFFDLSRNSFTFDEVTSIIITKSWHSMWPILWIKEGNMWFYFFILNLWQRIGNSEFILRSISAFFAVLTVPIFYLLAKEIRNEKTAKIATPLFIVNLYFIFYAQMARSYSLSLLLITLSAYFFLKLTKTSFSKLYLPPYIMVSVLAIYTHLLVVLAIATQYVYLFISPKKIPWKKVILAWIGIFICIVPLLLAPSVLHGHQLDWLQVHPFVFLPFGIVTLAGDSVFFTVLSGIIILILIWKKKHVIFEKSLEQFYLLWLFLWAGFPILFSYLFSVFVKPIYQPQYFNASLPAFILLVVIGLEELKQKKFIYYVLLAMLFFFSLLRLVQWYSGDTHYLTQFLVLENKHPDDWRDTASYVENNGKPSDAVIFYAYYVREAFEYYYNKYDTNSLPRLIEVSSGPYDLGGGTKIPEPNIPLLDRLSQKYPRVWEILENNNTNELGKKTQWVKIEKELNKYYIVISDRKLAQIEIKLFERK